MADFDTLDSLSSVIRRLRIRPAGPVSLRPGEACVLGVEGWGDDGHRHDPPRSRITWQVLDADGRPVVDGYEAPSGLEGTQIAVVFATQLHRSAPRVAYLVEATVQLATLAGASGASSASGASEITTAPTRLRPVTVHVSALGAGGVRALLTHLGHSLAAGAGTGTGVPVPVPPLELLGRPPLPVSLTIEAPDSPDRLGVLQLSTRVPELGRVVTGPIPMRQHSGAKPDVAPDDAGADAGSDYFRTRSSPATSTRTVSPSA